MKPLYLVTIETTDGWYRTLRLRPKPSRIERVRMVQYVGFHDSSREAQEAALAAVRIQLGVEKERVRGTFIDGVLLYPELYYPGQKEDWGMYFGLFSLEAKGKIDSYIFFVEGNDLQSAKNAALERYQIPLSAPVVWDIIKKVTFSLLVPFGIDGVDLVG